MLQAISTQCLFTGKRQAGSNGSELGAPPAKRAPPVSEGVME